MKTTPKLILALLVAGCTPQFKPAVLPAPQGPALSIGPAKVHETPPPGHSIAIDASGRKSKPNIKDGAPGGVTSNDWWSSLIYAQDSSSLESLPLYAHPLVLQTHAAGIGVSYPNEPKVRQREYMYRHDQDFIVGLLGFKAKEMEVVGHSDFDVHVDLRSGSSSLRATFGHGLPFLQVTRTSGAPDASIAFTPGKRIQIISNDDGIAVFRSGSRNYAAFAPEGSWTASSTGLVSDLGGRAHFAVAALPNHDKETLLLFADHAFAFIKRTSVSWETEGGVVTSTYRAETDLVESCAGVSSVQPEKDEEETRPPESTATCNRTTEALLALYPHQWANSSDSTVPNVTFESPRGPMRLVPSSQFQTKLTAQGLLPIPPIAPKERGRLRAWLKKEAGDERFPLGLGENPNYDAYWDGKSLGRVSTLAHIAEELGETNIRADLIDALEERLATWFDGEAPRYFYYDETWRSLMAFPDSYGSASHLNDHHFHYGYFIHAAATIARFNPDWAKKHGQMIELLIRDVAAIDENDPMFPRLRNMDPYAGHSWANGPAQFYEGNNQESSSEDINFSYSLALWGAMTENEKYEDLGLFLYATQVSAVEEYWFDVEDRVFPKGFDHPTVAMVWGSGGKYDTWFDQDPGIIHGINFLPFTGGSLYLGRHPDYVRKNFQTILDRSYGEVTTWRDPILMFAALGDPEEALRRYKKDRLFDPEFGASRTMTRLWLTSLAHYGLPIFAQAPASPYAIEFLQGTTKTRVSFDPTTRKMKQITVQ